jgi:predicted TIM-barrel fold metal-dependent hydrolase
VSTTPFSLSAGESSPLGTAPINDAHCHFFPTGFFSALGQQMPGASFDPPASAALRALGWEDPGADDALADRWVAELDRVGVSRAALIASVPNDGAAVGAAVRRHPTRVVGWFMVDPAATSAADTAAQTLDKHQLRGLCLFPAMHHVGLHDPRVRELFEVAATRPGTAAFVHCGVLSVGARAKLGLPSRFDMSLGNPLLLHRLALDFPTVPIVIPHFGAGLFREALMLADLCRNVYLDTSSSNRWVRYHPGLTLRAAFEQALAVLGAERLLFGTDSSFFPRGWIRTVYDEQVGVLDAIGVSPADRAAIFGGNFSRLFPIP